jgi:hypothetical protein
MIKRQNMDSGITVDVIVQCKIWIFLILLLFSQQLSDKVLIPFCIPVL